MKHFIASVILLVATSASAAPIELSGADIDLNDQKTIERGAKFFATNCLVCHSLKYLRYDKLAQHAGISYDKMPLGDREWWFGAAPPDLTLIASARGEDWLYTYLHSFYKDPSVPSGSNNLLMNNTAMPNPFLGLQGEQVLVVNKQALFSGRLGNDLHWYSALKMVRQGSMSSEQFDRAVNDVVTFLVYASDPHRVEREDLGWWVLGFLLIFVVVTYMTWREYHKEIEK